MKIYKSVLNILLFHLLISFSCFLYPRRVASGGDQSDGLDIPSDGKYEQFAVINCAVQKKMKHQLSKGMSI